jgi:Carboxypeptidase regulatory-like domain
VKRTVSIVAGLMLGCSGIAASGVESAPEPDYRASQLCMVDLVAGRPRQEPPRLVVHAIDQVGEVLPGARVAVEQPRDKDAVAKTDAAGHAVVEGLAVGNGRLRVEMEGFRPVDVTVRLKRGCVAAIIVPMEVGSMVESTRQSTRP